MLPKLKGRYVKKYSEVEVRNCLNAPFSSYLYMGRNKNELDLVIQPFHLRRHKRLIRKVMDQRCLLICHVRR